jgi:subtilisin family serine protease
MKKWILTGCLIPLVAVAMAQPLKNWQLLDPGRDSVYGISATRAYQELLAGRKAKTVIVGIIDSGVDTTHEDLKGVLWTDPSTGVHGWDYIGPEAGREDVTLLVADKKTFYDSLAYTMVPEAYRSGYQAHRKLEPQLESKINDMKAVVAELEEIRRTVDSILLRMGTSHPDTSDFNRYGGRDDKEKDLIRRMKRRMGIYPDWAHYYQAEIVDILAKARWHLAHGLNIDDPEKDTCLGDADVSPDKLGPVADPNIVAYHGTHVAGIIAAVRGNGIGMDGIADHVQIMMLKVNGALRELRDSSLARAIVFAVDHGAKVINLSFGKPYTWDKHAVDEAVDYAMKRDVLLVHAAGNSGDNLDMEDHFPNPVYADQSGKARAWLEVGASDAKGEAADFSNYGKRDVDVFAPGVDIYSTLPYNQYRSMDGTSMAAPVVTGLAALIREYYPTLTAVQVRDIIVHSVVKRPQLEDKCASGGLVNAYSALKLAATYN